MKTILLGIMIVLFSVPVCLCQAITVFSGRPLIKISEGGSERRAEKLPPERAVNLECVLSKIGEDYFWASRENTGLVKIEGAGFITYFAQNGAGYVRIVIPELKKAASLLGETEKRFDYVEHLVVGLKSVTYYGIRR